MQSQEPHDRTPEQDQADQVRRTTAATLAALADKGSTRAERDKAAEVLGATLGALRAAMPAIEDWANNCGVSMQQYRRRQAVLRDARAALEGRTA